MHDSAYKWVAEQVYDTPYKGATVVEIGSRWINGGVRELFTLASSYTGIDITDGLGVDVAADAAEWRPEEPVDIVVCCEVLEHTEQAEAVCRNAYKMLRRSGIFLVTCATDDRPPHSATDGGALGPQEFYRNVKKAELVRWLSDFDSIGTEEHRARGDLYARAVKG